MFLNNFKSLKKVAGGCAVFLVATSLTYAQTLQVPVDVEASEFRQLLGKFDERVMIVELEGSKLYTLSIPVESDGDFVPYATFKYDANDKLTGFYFYNPALGPVVYKILYDEQGEAESTLIRDTNEQMEFEGFEGAEEVDELREILAEMLGVDPDELAADIQSVLGQASQITSLFASGNIRPDDEQLIEFHHAHRAATLALQNYYSKIQSANAYGISLEQATTELMDLYTRDNKIMARFLDDSTNNKEVLIAAVETEAAKGLYEFARLRATVQMASDALVRDGGRGLKRIEAWKSFAESLGVQFPEVETSPEPSSVNDDGIELEFDQ